MNVIETVVKNDYCIGCGVCAGVCPLNNLHINWSTHGELNPYSKDSCKDNCSICIDICPFYDHHINQDDIANNIFSKTPNIQYNEYTGYFLDCYVGHHKNEEKRLKSASGGLATAFLSSLLKKEIIDKVAAVGTFANPDRMYEFKILNHPEELETCKGSAYYPVEISGVLKKILCDESEATYAIIALPCVVYSLRLAMEKIPKIKRKIKITASLTCGQLPNRFYSELLALESGISLEELLRIDFREKTKNNPAGNFLQVPISKDNRKGNPHPNLELPFHLCNYRFFTHNACSFCDDLFGEVADITFMDAWLPKYFNDYKGTSIVIVRTEQAQNLLESSDELNLHKLRVENVIESQCGVINNKRKLIKGRMYKKNMSNLWHPKKRVDSDLDVYIENREFIDLTDEIQYFSKELWSKYRLKKSTEYFWEDCNEIESKIKKYETRIKFRNLLKIPINWLKRLI